jgi:hypothetical protein
MTGMRDAPLDGRFVACCRGEIVTFAYFLKGRWIAPHTVEHPELGESEIFPTSWIAIQVPSRLLQNTYGA